MPDCYSTLSQLALPRCLFFFMSATSLFISYSHYRMNFLKKRILASLLVQTPNFWMNQLQLGAFMTRVKKAHPEVLSRLTILNFGFS